ncbi:MAG: hypothetical protein CMN30_13175 [Sandaracinus sp.]|nr:hypothetical protein [Sandaracinus sp.]
MLWEAMRTSLRVLASLVLLTACGDDDDDGTASDDAGVVVEDDGGTAPDTGVVDAGSRPPTTIGGERPATVRIPTDYDASGSYPLVVLLHGYGASGSVQELYFGLRSLVSSRGFVAVIPDGTENSGGDRFWNATAACCDFESTGVDDVAYISGLIDEAVETYAVDPDRVYLLGHSNGGFMSYRMACDASEKITAIASLAGAAHPSESDCGTPTEPTSVLQIHGTEDGTIQYEGAVGYPSAPVSVERFATRAGCGETMTTLDPLDFDSSIDGAETERVETSEGCADGTVYALWTIEAGGHIPTLADGAIGAAVDWLLAH